MESSIFMVTAFLLATFLLCLAEKFVSILEQKLKEGEGLVQFILSFFSTVFIILGWLLTSLVFVDVVCQVHGAMSVPLISLIVIIAGIYSAAVVFIQRKK